mmetsp:Transcript_37991/g.93374  ORF Transcript_37991/g.93374 Transcript_37991/m.93374 type:complete len:220 (-) Transcript_37991:58-717(-)
MAQRVALRTATSLSLSEYSQMTISASPANLMTSPPHFSTCSMMVLNMRLMVEVSESIPSCPSPWNLSDRRVKPEMSTSSTTASRSSAISSWFLLLLSPSGDMSRSTPPLRFEGEEEYCVGEPAKLRGGELPRRGELPACHGELPACRGVLPVSSLPSSGLRLRGPREETKFWSSCMRFSPTAWRTTLRKELWWKALPGTSLRSCTILMAERGTNPLKYP